MDLQSRVCGYRSVKREVPVLIQRAEKGNREYVRNASAEKGFCENWRMKIRGGIEADGRAFYSLYFL